MKLRRRSPEPKGSVPVKLALIGPDREPTIWLPAWASPEDVRLVREWMTRVLRDPGRRV